MFNTQHPDMVSELANVYTLFKQNIFIILYVLQKKNDCVEKKHCVSKQQQLLNKLCHHLIGKRTTIICFV